MGAFSDKNLYQNKNKIQSLYKKQKENKNKDSLLDMQLKENKYKCTLILDETEVPGFLCDFRYSRQNKLVPTIITYKYLFPGDFNFKEENKYIHLRYDYKNLETKSKQIYIIYDNYNIVIFQIPDLTDFSYLKIYTYNPNFYHIYKLYDLIYSTNILDCHIELSKNRKGYIFNYYEKNKEYKKYKNSLILNENNYIIGISMGSKYYNGITIYGIIKEIKENQTNQNKKKNVEVTKSNSDDKNNNNVFIHQNKTTFTNKDYSNNQKANKEELILNKNNRYKKDNNLDYRLNKEINNLKNTDNGKDKNINFDDNNNNNNIYEISKKSGKEKEKEKEKEENCNVVKIIKKDIENEKEINLYFLFKNEKELYLDVKESFIFEKVIEQLNEKYLWLKNIEIKEYQFNKRKIDNKKSVKENKLKDNSTIYIIEYH